MANNVLAFAETRGGDVRKVAYEAVTAARRSPTPLAAKCTPWWPGAPGHCRQGRALGAPARTVVTASSTRRSPTTTRKALAAFVAERVKAGGYRAVTLVASAQGKDLAPRVAAKLGVPLAGPNDGAARPATRSSARIR